MICLTEVRDAGNDNGWCKSGLEPEEITQVLGHIVRVDTA